MIIFAIQDMKIKYLSSLPSAQNKAVRKNHTLYGDEVFPQNSKWLKIMGPGGFSKVLKGFLIKKGPIFNQRVFEW